jgi:hypothetical protein
LKELTLIDGRHASSDPAIGNNIIKRKRADKVSAIGLGSRHQAGRQFRRQLRQ